MSRTSSAPLLAAALLLSAPAAPAHEYSVLDVGATGVTNQTWSISENGFVVGYSSVGGHDEGFFFDGTSTVFIGTPPQTSRSDLLAVNDFGHAVGKSGTVHENGEAILWMEDGSPDGRIRSLGALGGSRSAAMSINAADQIVGWTKLAGDAESRPFIWEDDVMTALPLLGGTQGSADWINDGGQIVGASTTDTDGLQQFAVLWDEGTVTRLPPFHAGLNNIANYIHDNGDIAGSIRTPRDGGGFLTRAGIWRNGDVFLELGTLADGTPVEPFANSWASGINDDGAVVGMSVNADSDLVPFVYRDGEMMQLDGLIPDGWVLTFLGSGAINDAGQIAVSGFLPGETGERALLLTPAPTVDTPSTMSAASHVPIGVVPNPFRQATSFRIGAIGRSITLNIFDASGRHIHTLTSPASTRDGFVRWDGRDASGLPVPAGVYFVQLPGEGSAARVLKIR